MGVKRPRHHAAIGEAYIAWHINQSGSMHGNVASTASALCGSAKAQLAEIIAALMA